VSFTTDEQIESLQEKYGLTLDQAHTVVAKAGLVRHLARAPEQSQRLALKGGTLLHGLLDSPRVSVADVDYADANPNEKLTTDEIKDALTFESDGLSVRGTEGTWVNSNGVVGSADVPYQLDAATSSGQAETGTGPLSVSVSVRQGEVVGGISIVTFKAPYIDEPEFEVPAISLEEQLCEKVIAYAMKHFNKHIVDLAIAARDWQGEFDPDRVVEIFVARARAEKQLDADRFRNVERVSDFSARFHDERRTKRMLKEWGDPDKELFFSLDEQELRDPVRVLEVASQFWTPILESLPDELLDTPEA
jgi:hypothetical protein